MTEAVRRESFEMTELQSKTESRPAPVAEAEKPAPDFSARSQPSYAYTLFLGPEGLRPGWGLAFYVVLYVPLQRLAVRLAWSHELGPSGLWSELLEELGILLAAIVPSLLLARIERRPWDAYGLPGPLAFGKLFWTGAVWGFTAISLLILTLYGMGAFRFGHLALHGARIAKFAAFWAALFLLVGLSEEFRFRGYAQFALGRGIGFWPAAGALSAAFGLIHVGNGGEDLAGLLAAAAIGFFFCLTLRRTGNLWFAVGFHAAWDWGETFLYSVPDSGNVWPGHLLRSSLRGKDWLTGGSVGPEGSLLCFLVIGLAWIAFHHVYPQKISSQK